METPKDIKDTEEFRDRIATIGEDGKRNWIYPKKPKGRFYKWRTYVSWFLLAALFGMPFIKVNGEPLLLFNVIERKFILFSIVFTPQDLHLFALAMITLVVFIVLFTVVFGRLFCGWACPQTIFMEMVFRKIEYAIEGDFNAQRRLDKAPWTSDKIMKKGLKHAIFFAIAVLIANTFLSYIIGVDNVMKIVQEPVSLHMGGFIAMLIFSAVFYFVFSRFREQVCVAVCPYGRMQGVLLVPDSVVVHYDFVRGEPRGKLKKKKQAKLASPVTNIQKELATASLEAGQGMDKLVDVPIIKKQGDCIDCGLCVRVCPTGIDIRNGTQLECINCTACIDACDEVMDKVRQPRGLIRYDSYAGIKEGRKKIFTTRAIAYSGVLAVLLILQVVLFSLRTEVETVVLRTPGMLYQQVDETYISNLYNYQVINKTLDNISNIEFKLNSPIGRIKLVGDSIPTAQGQRMSEGAFFIEMEKDKLESYKTKLSIEIWSNGEMIDKAMTNFLGPLK